MTARGWWGRSSRGKRTRASRSLLLRYLVLRYLVRSRAVNGLPGNARPLTLTTDEYDPDLPRSLRLAALRRRLPLAARGHAGALRLVLRQRATARRGWVPSAGTARATCCARAGGSSARRATARSPTPSCSAATRCARPGGSSARGACWPGRTATPSCTAATCCSARCATAAPVGTRSSRSGSPARLCGRERRSQSDQCD
jgi:hypothetical protein